MGMGEEFSLSLHKWIEMLSQQSYFHIEFNPVKPSVTVMEFFWWLYLRACISVFLMHGSLLP